MNSHTPKPWRINDNSPFGCFEILGPDGKLIATIPNNREIGEAVGNLHLMVKAPELVATLDEIANKVIHLPEDVPTDGQGDNLLGEIWGLANMAVCEATDPRTEDETDDNS